MKPFMRRRQRGFSLMELMIAVAIVGILASVAYPSYRAYVTRSNRTDTQQALLQMAQQAERYFAVHGSYDPEDGESLADFLSNAASETRAREVYDFEVETLDEGDDDCPNVAGFKITATPDDENANKDDGTLILCSNGVAIWDHPEDGRKNWSDR